MKEPRVSLQTLRVLHTFVVNAEPMCGADIIKRTNLKTGVLYPILLRLERAGWLHGETEAAEPSKLGRPRKTFYTVTDKGRTKTEEAFKELQGI